MILSTPTLTISIITTTASSTGQKSSAKRSTKTSSPSGRLRPLQTFPLALWKVDPDGDCFFSCMTHAANRTVPELRDLLVQLADALMEREQVDATKEAFTAQAKELAKSKKTEKTFKKRRDAALAKVEEANDLMRELAFSWMVSTTSRASRPCWQPAFIGRTLGPWRRCR